MSIVEIAKQAGVSPATVSRVFNRPELVSAATRNRILETAQRHGYQPNSAAQSLRTQRSRMLGVMLPTFGNPVFAECLEGIAACAGERGFGIMPVTSDYHPQREQVAIERLIARGVDALVMVLRNPDESESIQGLSIPFVLAYNQHEQFCCVGVDGRAEVAKVVNHLASLGHERIVMVSGALAASDRARQRYQGYLHGLHETGLEPMKLIEVDFIGSEMPALAAVLSQPDHARPTALVCSNDLLALRAIRLARQSGLAVPDSLSVVGFDGIGIGSEISPALSTVVQPSRDIGYQAAALAIGQIDQGREPEQTSALHAVSRTLNATENPAHIMHTLPCFWRAGETVAAVGAPAPAGAPLQIASVLEDRSITSSRASPTTRPGMASHRDAHQTESEPRWPDQRTGPRVHSTVDPLVIRR